MEKILEIDGKKVKVTTKDARNMKIKAIVHDGRQIEAPMGIKLRAEWCECNAGFDPELEIIFRDDNVCNCGCIKHHYHCPKCGRINQVG